MKLDWQIVSRVLFGILLAVVGWIGGQSLLQLQKIQTELTSIKLELVKVQATMMTEEAVRMIVKDEIYTRVDRK
jgi:hypothetical protein